MASREDLRGALAKALRREPTPDELESAIPHMERHLDWIGTRLPNYGHDKSLESVARVASEGIWADARQRAKHPLRRSFETVATLAVCVGSTAFVCYLLWNLPEGRVYGPLCAIIGGAIGWRNRTHVKPWNAVRVSDRASTALFYSFMGLWVACLLSGLLYPFS